jgi:hypothetical protein
MQQPQGQAGFSGYRLRPEYGQEIQQTLINAVGDFN